VSLRKHNFGAESTKELLKPSKDSASLRVCNEKKLGGLGFSVNGIISRVVFGHFGPFIRPLAPTPRYYYFNQVCIANSAKIWDFWYFGWLAGFQVWKFWPKNNKISNESTN